MNVPSGEGAHRSAIVRNAHVIYRSVTRVFSHAGRAFVAIWIMTWTGQGAGGGAGGGAMRCPYFWFAGMSSRPIQAACCRTNQHIYHGWNER